MILKKERYQELEKSGEAPTPEEQKLGVHYCFEWDLLLLEPTSPEWSVCSCYTPEERATIEAAVKAAGYSVGCWPMEEL